jgi:multiple sugar transport system ATP-binding protein
MTDRGFRLPDGTLIETDRGLPEATTCGIRPEHFHLGADALDCEVVVVEPTGSETQVIGRVGGQQITAVFRDRPDVRPGDRINLRPDPDKLHFFDATGRRLG